MKDATVTKLSDDANPLGRREKHKNKKKDNIATIAKT